MQINSFLISIFLLSLILIFAPSCSKEASIAPSFEILPSNSNNFLWRTYFVSDSIGYICGGEQYTASTLLKTTDGGNTWKNKETSINKTLFDLHFFDKDHGIAVGYDNKIIHTYDGGNSWQLQQIHYNDSEWLPLRSIHFVNDTLGLIAGGIGYSLGVILRTTDGGQNWDYELFDREFRDIVLLNDSIGYVCGYGAIYKTTDGGISWFPLAVSGDFFTRLHFPSLAVGYAVGNQGAIIKTETAGLHWETLQSANTFLQNRQNLESVYFVNEEKGYIVGRNTLSYTTDGGYTWQAIADLDFSRFTDIHLRTDQKAFIIGDKGTIASLYLP